MKRRAAPKRTFWEDERAVTRLVCAGLFLLVWAVFGRTLGHDFVNFDDNQTVYDSEMVTQGLTLEGIRWAFLHPVLGHFSPLTTISHLVDCQIYGLSPWGHHLTNVLLHATGAVLLFLALRSLTGATWRSAFVAAVFAAHPLRVESVAWVTERKDVLSGVFFALTLLAYAAYVRRRGWGRYAVVLACFACGLMSKSMLVTLPLVLLLLDCWPLGRLAEKWWLLLEKLPFLSLSAGAAVLQVVGAHEMIAPFAKLPLSLRVENALISYAAYLWQMIWPAHLAVLYPHPGETLPLEQAALAALLLAAISLLVFLERKRRPWLAVGWLWYLGMLLPVIGLVQSGEIARADRYTYLPQIGIYLAVTWSVSELTTRRRWSPRILAGASAVGLLLLGSVAAVQTAHWKNSETLWRHALAQGIRSWTIHQNLGIALAESGRPEEAIAQWKEALTLNPRSVQVHNNLGTWLLRQGRYDEAIAYDRAGLRLDPGDGHSHTNLGYALQLKGDLAGAMREYQEALRCQTGQAEAHFAIGTYLKETDHLDQAIAEFHEALRLRKKYPEAYYNLGATLARQGLPAEAEAEYRKALHYRPAYAEVHYDLGILLASAGHVDQAVPELLAAVQNKPDFADAQNNLGAALTEVGRIDEGITHYRKAIELFPEGVNARFNLGQALLAQGKVDEAIEQFHSVLEREPGHADARAQLEAAQRMKEALAAPSPVETPR